MAITEIRHAWSEPVGEPSVLTVRFDRELNKREAAEVAQAVVGVHNRHEAARSFYAHDPHRAVHLTDKAKAAMVTETADLDEAGEPAFIVLRHDDGTPVIDIEHPKELAEIAQVTRTFTGTCGDCGRELVAGSAPKLPHHYVCPTLPSETDPYITFRETVEAEGDVIYCGRPR